MTSYPSAYGNYPMPASLVCSCGVRFKPRPDQEIYCSRRCAQEEGLRALQGKPTQYKRLARQGPEHLEYLQHMEELLAQEKAKGRSRFSKPLPRVLTVWKEEEGRVDKTERPPTPPPKPARHLPLVKAMEQQQEEFLKAIARPHARSEGVSDTDESLPVTPADSPIRRKRHAPIRIDPADLDKFVVADDTPPVPPMPSRYIDGHGGHDVHATTRGHTESHERNLSNSIPATFEELEKARISQLVCRPRRTRPSRKPVPPLLQMDFDSSLDGIENFSDGEASLSGLGSPASATQHSAISGTPVSQTQVRPIHRLPGRRSPIQVLGEDIPVLVPEGYVSESGAATAVSRTNRVVPSTRLREPSGPTARAPRLRAIETQATRSRTPAPDVKSHGTSVAKSFLDVHYPVEDKDSSDLWRAVQALRVQGDEEDCRQRLLNRPTIYEA